MKVFFDRFLKPIMAVAFAIAIAGICAYPFMSFVKRADKNDTNIESVRAATGAGALFAVMGGFKTLAADLVWIKSYTLWEKRDLAGCVAAMQLASDIDPYAINFWYQAAGIIAFDTPHWIIEENPKRANSVEFQKMIRTRQAKQAISYIDRALKIFPDSDKLWIRKGEIAMIFDDWKLAAKCYEVPALKPDSMVYVRRIYAAMLARSGEYKKSLAVFEKLYAEAEEDSPLKPIFKKEIGRLHIAIEKTRLDSPRKN